MKVAVLGFFKSSNIGDQLIGDQLMYQLEPFCSARLFDIKGPGKSNIVLRVAKVILSYYLPKVFRRELIRIYLLAKYAAILKKYYIQMIQDADLVVVGGGQLFRENDSYNLFLVERLYRLLKKFDKRFLVINCGVSEISLEPSKRLCRSFFDSHLNLLTLLRDRTSIENLRSIGVKSNRLDSIPDIVFAMPIKSRETNVGSFTGVCVTNPMSMAYYGDNIAIDSRRKIERKILKLVEKLCQKGPILLFTNGNPEDHIFARNLRKSLSVFPNIRVARRPKCSNALLRTVLLCSKVITFRLHVFVIAKVLQVPTEIVTWDKKMKHLQDYGDANSDETRGRISFEIDKVKEIMSLTGR